MAHSKHSGLSVVVLLLVGYVLYEWFKTQPSSTASTSGSSAAAAAPTTPLLSNPPARVGPSLPSDLFDSSGNFLVDPVQGFVNPTTGAPAVNPILTATSGAFSQSQVEEETVAGLFPKSYAFGGSPLLDASGGGGGGGGGGRIGNPYTADPFTGLIPSFGGDSF